MYRALGIGAAELEAMREAGGVAGGSGYQASAISVQQLGEEPRDCIIIPDVEQFGIAI